MIKTDDKIEALEDKARVFFSQGIKVHIIYKRADSLGNNIWGNGIIKQVSSTFFLFDEVKEGKIVVFFTELKDIVQYTERSMK